MYRIVSITNKNEDTVIFDNRLRIVNGFDLSGLQAAVNSTEGTFDGSIYQNTRLTNRSVEIEARLMRRDFSEAVMDMKRKNLYRAFNPKSNPMRVDFETTDGTRYYFNAYASSSPVMPPDYANNNKAYQKFLLPLIATDPFIYTADATVDEIASYGDSGFEFTLEIPEEGITFEQKSESLFKNVINTGSDEIGMIVTFLATAAVSNPSVSNAETYEFFKVNFDMIAGDMIKVSSVNGEYGVVLIRNNVETDIFNDFTLDSTFFKLRPGDNILSYGADDGLDFLEVRIEHRDAFTGV